MERIEEELLIKNNEFEILKKQHVEEMTEERVKKNDYGAKLAKATQLLEES